MEYSQKYCLVHLLQPMEDGTQFHADRWPLHVTLADVFAIDWQSTNVDTKLSAMLSGIKTAATTALSDSILGTTPVALLDKTPEILKLHSDIISLLEENCAVFNDPGFTKEGFIPHYTIQDSEKMNIGDAININSVTLIDMFPDNDWRQRRVIRTFKM